MPRKSAKLKSAAPNLDFPALVEAIRQTHQHCAARASHAVNASLTLRNWAIGFYICQYELRGDDRAKYGERLIDALAEALTAQGISRCERRELYRYRLFYRVYPQIMEAATPQSLPGFGRLAIEQSAAGSS